MCVYIYIGTQQEELCKPALYSKSLLIIPRSLKAFVYQTPGSEWKLHHVLLPHTRTSYPPAGAFAPSMVEGKKKKWSEQGTRDQATPMTHNICTMRAVVTVIGLWRWSINDRTHTLRWFMWNTWKTKGWKCRPREAKDTSIHKLVSKRPEQKPKIKN